MRALRLAAFVGCEDQLESVGTAESDGFLGKGLVAESAVRVVRCWAGDCRESYCSWEAKGTGYCLLLFDSSLGLLGAHGKRRILKPPRGSGLGCTSRQQEEGRHERAEEVHGGGRNAVLRETGG